MEFLMRIHRSDASTCHQFQLVTHGLSNGQSVFGQMFAELLKTTIVVVSDIGIRLAQLFSNLCECVSLKKMQPQRFPLLPRQSTLYFPPAISSEEPLDGLIVFCSRCCSRISLRRPVCNSGRVEAAILQLPSAKKSLRIGNLKDPRAG